MKSASIFKEIMREYEKDRLLADNLFKNRRDEVYFAIPEIKHIDNELTSSALKITKLMLLGQTDKQALISELEAQNAELLKKKEELLSKHRYEPGYLIDVYSCNTCKDTGFVGGERCSCLKQRLINKYYELSNLKKVLQTENFDTFDLNYYADDIDSRLGVSPKATMRIIYMNCLNFVKNFDTRFENLLLYGSTALGKTFLCNCIAKELLDMGKTVVYTTASKLFKQVEEFRFNRNSDNGEALEEFLDLAYNAELLIIDDLGTEFSTAVTATELFNIINTRLLEQRPVIISTNMSPSDFHNQYSDRITSRIIGNYTLLRFVGEDIRLKKRYGM